MVNVEEILQKHDANLSPSRYIETTTAIEHRDIQVILNDLGKLESEAGQLNGELKDIFSGLGYQWPRA